MQSMLYHVHLPEQDTDNDFANNFRNEIAQYLKEYDVYLLFDRYYSDSIKQMTRNVRGSPDASMMLLIIPTTYIPPRDDILSSTHKKMIDVIYQNLIDHVAEFSVVNRILFPSSTDF